MQYLIVFCGRLNGAHDVTAGSFMEPIVPDKFVQFRDPRLNSSGEMQPKAVGCGIFGRFSNFDNWRPEVTCDVMFQATFEHVGVDVRAEFGGSRLNSGRTILLYGRPDPVCTLLRSTYIVAFSTDWKHLVTSYPAGF